jgi:hypothetical protein
MSLPHIHYPYDTLSGTTTPWNERAPLFAHELVGPHDGEMESPITSESVDSPIKPEPQEEIIDMNDPTLERFPEDRISILTHIRSCESRMSEDETNVQGVPPSPIARAKSRSPSIDTPGSARLDAQPSPVLDIIAEEHQEEDNYFTGLPGPIHNVQKAEEVRQPEELNVIHEAEEPADNPKIVLDNLKKIEESTTASHNGAIKEGVAKPEANEFMPSEETRPVEEYHVIAENEEPSNDQSESMDSLSSDRKGNPLNLQPGPTSSEIQSQLHNQEESKDGNSDVEKVNPSNETGLNASVNLSAHPFDPVDQATNVIEQDQEDFGGKQGQLYAYDGLHPEVRSGPEDNFNDHVAVNHGQIKVESTDELMQDGDLHEAEENDDEQKEVSLSLDVIIPQSGQNLVNNQDKIPEKEGPNDDMNADVIGHGNVTLEEHNAHLQSMEVGRVPDTRQLMPELNHSVELEERHNILPEHIGAISMNGTVIKDSTIESTIEAQGVAQASPIQKSTVDHDILERDTHQSNAAPEALHTEYDLVHGNNLPESKAGEISQSTDYERPGSESQVENASMDLDKLAILNASELAVETSHEEEFPVFPAEASEGSLSATGDAPGSDNQAQNEPTGLHKSAIAIVDSRIGLGTGDEVDLTALPGKTDEVQLTTEHEAFGSNIQVENASTEAVKSVATFENPTTGLDTTQGTNLPDIRKDAVESLLALDPEVLGLAMAESVTHVDQPSADVEPTRKVDLPISQIKVDEKASGMLAKQVMDSEVDKSAPVQGTQPEVETLRGADLSLPQLTLADAMPLAGQVSSGKIGVDDTGRVDCALTNGVDGSKSTSVDASSQNGHDNDSKLAPLKTAPPNIDRQLTPDSMRSPMKSFKSENKKSIWQWLGGLVASLCGGERGP